MKQVNSWKIYTETSVWILSIRIKTITKMAAFGQKRGASKVTGSKSESAQVLRTTKPSDKLNPKTVDPVCTVSCFICFGFTHDHVFGGVGLCLWLAHLFDL